MIRKNLLILSVLIFSFLEAKVQRKYGEINFRFVFLQGGVTVLPYEWGMNLSEWGNTSFVTYKGRNIIPATFSLLMIGCKIHGWEIGIRWLEGLGTETKGEYFEISGTGLVFPLSISNEGKIKENYWYNVSIIIPWYEMDYNRFHPPVCYREVFCFDCSIFRKISFTHLGIRFRVLYWARPDADFGYVYSRVWPSFDIIYTIGVCDFKKSILKDCANSTHHSDNSLKITPIEAGFTPIAIGKDYATKECIIRIMGLNPTFFDVGLPTSFSFRVFSISRDIRLRNNFEADFGIGVINWVWSVPYLFPVYLQVLRTMTGKSRLYLYTELGKDYKGMRFTKYAIGVCFYCNGLTDYIKIEFNKKYSQNGWILGHGYFYSLEIITGFNWRIQ